MLSLSFQHTSAPFTLPKAKLEKTPSQARVPCLMESTDVLSQLMNEKVTQKPRETPVAVDSAVAAERNSGSYTPYVTMISLFTSGLALAVGHHLLYSSLDGRQLNQVSVSQAWVIREGTAFAFAFKTVLVSAIGAA